MRRNTASDYNYCIPVIGGICLTGCILAGTAILVRSATKEGQLIGGGVLFVTCALIMYMLLTCSERASRTAMSEDSEVSSLVEVSVVSRARAKTDNSNNLSSGLRSYNTVN